MNGPHDMGGMHGFGPVVREENEPVFHEDIVNKILDDVYRFLEPRYIKVTGYFNVRGGIAIDVVAERGDSGA